MNEDERQEKIRQGKIRENCCNNYNNGYDVGYVDALRLFAYWKDGVQYVGTRGTTLKEAIKEFEEKRK